MHQRCIQCGATFELHERLLACAKCGDLVEIVALSGEPAREPKALKKLWLERRASKDARDRSGVWRFREVLPDYSAETVVTLAEGNVSLIAGKRTARWSGVRDLWFKHLG